MTGSSHPPAPFRRATRAGKKEGSGFARQLCNALFPSVKSCHHNFQSCSPTYDSIWFGFWRQEVQNKHILHKLTEGSELTKAWQECERTCTKSHFYYETEMSFGTRGLIATKLTQEWPLYLWAFWMRFQWPSLTGIGGHLYTRMPTTSWYPTGTHILLSPFRFTFYDSYPHKRLVVLLQSNSTLGSGIASVLQ